LALSLSNAKASLLEAGTDHGGNVARQPLAKGTSGTTRPSKMACRRERFFMLEIYFILYVGEAPCG
jgi:hypothetical protein